MKKRGGLIVIIAAAVVLELISAIQYYHSRGILEEELEQQAVTELMLKAVITKRTIDNTERSLKSHIREIKSSLHTPDSLSNILTWVIRYHPNSRGAGVAFSPYYYPQKGRLFEPYALRNDSGGIESLQIAGERFDYTRDGFYRDIIEKRTGGWVGPYNDMFLHQRMISYAVPIIGAGQGDTVAVFGVDIDTRFLSESMNTHHMYPSSFTLLLTEKGELIAGPSDPRQKKNGDVVVRIINDSTAPKEKSSNGQATIAAFRDVTDGDVGYVFYSNFTGHPHWQIATVYYDEEVYGPLINQRIYMALLMLIAFAVLGFIVWRFFRSERKLRTTELRQERLSSELHIARDIQVKMLPNVYPPFPERKDIDLYGLLEPAREVGGDLFDFFIRDEKLFFCIGDVSGKGVPAAMLMAVTHSLFRSASAHDSNPSRIMHNLNETLCQGNDSNMFVTMFIGVLNLPTGRLRYCNAGHDKPVIISDGTARSIEATAHLPLGVFPDTRYDSEERMLKGNDILFLFTDGLTEAKDMEHQQFRLQRVVDKLQSRDWSEAFQLVNGVEQEVRAFMDDAEQSDDLTLLVIKKL